MTDDNGVYILISPTENNNNRMEYRVAYLEGDHNITWTLNAAHGTEEAVDPKEVKPYFDKSTTYTSSMDAEEEAYRLADNRYMTTPPIYHVYASTPYPKWCGQEYAKKHQN